MVSRRNVVALLALALAGLSGCIPSHDLGKLTLSIGMPEGSKTILPTLAVSTYTISFSGPVAHDDLTTTDKTASIELEAGSWSIGVQGLDDGGNMVAAGSAMGVIVSAGATTSANVALSAQLTGNGSIAVTLSWPSSLAPAIDTVSVSLDGTPVPLAAVSHAVGSSTASYTETKPAGSYELVIGLYSGAALRATVSEPVQVYGNLTSTGSFTLVDADFSSPPAAPDSVTVTEGQDRLVVGWADASLVETAYVVSRGTGSGGPFADLATLDANVTSYEDASVSAGVTYWYQVRSRNVIGDSSPASAASGMMVAAPTPGGSGALGFSSVGSASFVVGWAKASDNTSPASTLQYKVVRSTAGNVSDVAGAEANGTVCMDWTTDVSTCTATGLNASTTYWLNVLVKDAAGNESAYVSSSQATAAVSVTRIIDHTNYDPSSELDADIAKAAALDVYFEHASVGLNVLHGLETLATQNVRYTCGRSSLLYPVTPSASWFATNDGLEDYDRGNPGATSKYNGFDSRLRASSGLLAGAVDVATFKFCYIDLQSTTASDGTALFNYVRPVMESLQATYPSVVFVWWTMPIETNGSSYAARQTYNNAVRAYCLANGQWLLDIADLESHDNAGAACIDVYGREILYAGYTTDGGHLPSNPYSSPVKNSPGSLKVAKAYWKLIAEIAKTR
jgi:hypothetical protein